MAEREALVSRQYSLYLSPEFRNFYHTTWIDAHHQIWPLTQYCANQKMHHPPPPASIATEYVRLHLARFIWSINRLNICLEMRCASVYLSTQRIALKVKLKT